MKFFTKATSFVAIVVMSLALSGCPAGMDMSNIGNIGVGTVKYQLRYAHDRRLRNVERQCINDVNNWRVQKGMMPIQVIYGNRRGLDYRDVNRSVNRLRYGGRHSNSALGILGGLVRLAGSSVRVTRESEVTNEIERCINDQTRSYSSN